MRRDERARREDQMLEVGGRLAKGEAVAVGAVGEGSGSWVVVEGVGEVVLVSVDGGTRREDAAAGAKTAVMGWDAGVDVATAWCVLTADNVLSLSSPYHHPERLLCISVWSCCRARSDLY